MQSENIQADYEQLEQMAADMGKEADQLQQLMTVSRQRLEGLLSTAWQGEAAGAYLREMLDDTLPGFKRLVDALRFSGETIQQLQRDFSAAEDEAAGLFNRSETHSEPAERGESPRLIDIPDLRAISSFEQEKQLIEPSGGQEQKSQNNMTWLNSEITFWKDEKELANYAAYEGKYSGEWGSVSGRLLSYDATIGTRGTIDLSNGSLNLEGYFKGGAYLAQSSYSGEFGALSLAADGFVGAELDAHAGVSFKPASGDVGANAGFDAFVGAKATGTAAFKVIDTDIIDITPKVTVSGLAGIGASANVDVGFSDKKIRVNFKAGAALKIGGEVGGGIEIDLSGLLAKVAEVSQQAQASRMASK